MIYFSQPFFPFKAVHQKLPSRRKKAHTSMHKSIYSLLEEPQNRKCLCVKPSLVSVLIILFAGLLQPTALINLLNILYMYPL